MKRTLLSVLAAVMVMAACVPTETQSIAKNSKSFLMFELILLILVIDISLQREAKA